MQGLMGRCILDRGDLMERLDRVLLDDNRRILFPQPVVEHLPQFQSDRDPDWSILILVLRLTEDDDLSGFLVLAA